MVKSAGVQRESDGVVVPVIGVQQNAPGGKGPDFDHASGGGKREGMAGFARSTTPAGMGLSWLVQAPSWVSRDR
jgi:RNA-directed DNA polymerase